MSRTAIISVDGHVKASRAGYRDYVEEEYLDDFAASYLEVGNRTEIRDKNDNVIDVVG